jgi:hypothetical protein
LLLADVGAALVPFVPAIGVIRHAGKLEKVAAVFKGADDAADAAKAVKGAERTGEAAKQAAQAQKHHIATDKSIKSGFTKDLEDIFNKAGMNLQDPTNKMILKGHKGRHAGQYHKNILSRLQNATEGLLGDAYGKALREELDAIRRDLLKNPKMVRGEGL